MSTFKDKITIPSSTPTANYKLADDAIFFINSTTQFTVNGSGNVSALYYVVGGGGGGSKGTQTGSTRGLGRGGGGGGVEAGRIDLMGGKTYTISVGPGGTGQTDSPATNGTNSTITATIASGTNVSITANGGNSSGANAGNGSSSATNTGVTKSDGSSDVNTASSAASGKGGISSKIGSIAGVPRATTGATDASGTHSPSVGGGGGGGYGLTGYGGNGGKGVVILILTDNSNKIQYIEKQLREMNQLPGTMVDQYNQQYNAAMMAGALWTVLATSLVFYVFTQV